MDLGKEEAKDIYYSWLKRVVDRRNIMKRAGWNPTKRNRNIGTSKQGYGSDNEFATPQPADTLLYYYERYEKAETSLIHSHGKDIPVIVEDLKKDYHYSCTAKDVERILNHLPEEDLHEFGLLIFRQPKRKEEILCPVWGRLVYSLEYKDDFYPAIIIEATPEQMKLRHPKKQTVGGKLKFNLLIDHGITFKEYKREFIADITEEDARNIQLYKTLLHEVGHYVHYLERVERPGFEEEGIDEWEKRYNKYLQIVVREKEEFADRYAVNMGDHLIEKGIIPFDRIEG